MKIKEPEDLLKMDKDWWQVQAWLLAHDRDKYVGPVELEVRIWLRKN